MDLAIHSPMPRRTDFRIGILGSGFIVNDCHLVAYRKAGFNPVAIASRTRAHAEQVAARHAAHFAGLIEPGRELAKRVGIGTALVEAAASVVLAHG